MGEIMQEQDNKKLTMDDVARELGVSKTTVSRAVSGKGRIGDETRQRVLDFIAKHNYKPNTMAAGLAGSCTYNIGMVLPSDLLFSDLPFFPAALKGISEIASSKEYDLILTLVEANDLTRLERVIENRKVDGLILMRTLKEDRAAAMLKKSGIPFVTMGLSKEPGVYQVDNDHEEACHELTSILLMKGMKKIAVIAGDMNYIINQNRLGGFCRAYQEQGMTPDESLIFMDAVTPVMIERAVDAVKNRSVSCIISADDLIASAILQKLEAEGLKIPIDIRLASFHDSGLLAASKVGITAVKFNTEELGREACRVLLRRIQGEDVPYVTKLPYEVALRESTK